MILLPPSESQEPDMDNMDMNKSDSDSMKENKKGKIVNCEHKERLYLAYTNAACKVLLGLRLKRFQHLNSLGN